MVFANAKCPQYVKSNQLFAIFGDVTRIQNKPIAFIKYVIGYFVNAKCPNFEFEPLP